MNLIEQARQHLANGNKHGYAQLLASEHNSGPHLRSAIQSAINEDGTADWFKAMRNGTLVPNRAEIDGYADHPDFMLIA